MRLWVISIVLALALMPLWKVPPRPRFAIVAGMLGALMGAVFGFVAILPNVDTPPWFRIEGGELLVVPASALVAAALAVGALMLGRSWIHSDDQGVADA